ncbi:MAG: nucleotidyltransferase domain-containing protein [Gammaproteobacteria bacterium]|nr:nucleotidyltransferase domain-containing protein [Gammaproteobacteria bacterium]
MAILTLKERDAIAVKKRRDALSRVRVLLADVAREYGGQFWLFGSASRGDIRKDSDIDLVADFPLDVERRAVCAAESACAQANIPCDIVERRTCSDRFWTIISPDLTAIP